MKNGIKGKETPSCNNCGDIICASDETTDEENEILDLTSIEGCWEPQTLSENQSN